MATTQIEDQRVLSRMRLVEDIEIAAELNRQAATETLEAIFDCMVDALRGGDKVEVRRFGSFRLRKRNARRGRNPLTGAVVEVPAKSVVYFTPSQELKRILRAASQDGPAAKTGDPS